MSNFPEPCLCGDPLCSRCFPSTFQLNRELQAFEEAMGYSAEESSEAWEEFETWRTELEQDEAGMQWEALEGRR